MPTRDAGECNREGLSRILPCTNAEQVNLSKEMSFKLLPLLFALPVLLTSCSYIPFIPYSGDNTAPAATASLPAPSEPGYVNPHPAGTYDHFKAEPNYTKTYNVYRNHSALASLTPDSARLRINLTSQRAQLLNNEEVALDYPVATGKSSHPTPPGSYQVLEKEKDKRSNLYGKILDSSGSVVKADADANKDKVPPGGEFLGASMPYWMRFTWTGIGHHVGNVPRYPPPMAASAAKAPSCPRSFRK